MSTKKKDYRPAPQKVSEKINVHDYKPDPNPPSPKPVPSKPNPPSDTDKTTE